MTTLIAPICGPIFGGYISDNYTWPWIFLINLPIGLLCAAICWRMLMSRETPTRKVPVDRVGFALLVVWVGALQVMLDKGKDADWWASSMIVALAVVAAVGFVAWLIWELTDANPIVDLSLFKSRNFAIGTLAFCLGYALLFGNLVLLPLWLQTQLNYTATWAGLVAAPAGVSAVILSPIAARVMSRIDARWTATISFVAFAISYLMRANYTPDSSFMTLMIPLVVQGIAMSVFFVSMLTILLNGIPPQKIPSASGLSNFARITAGGFAASLTTVVWDRREAVHQSRLSDSSGFNDPIMLQALARLQHDGLSMAQSLGVLGRNLVNQAYMLSSLDFFWISGWLCFAVLPLVWLTHRSVAGGGAHVAAD
jgi:DHA2 family multidrug resistance protein